MEEDLSIDELEAQILLLEKKIVDEPRRIREEQERKMTTMPASDDVLDRERERLHNMGLTRGELQNIRITQAKDGVLLVFFLLGILSLSFWIYNTIQSFE